MEKNKKPISIDFDKLDAELQATKEESMPEPSNKIEQKEKKPRIVKKKENPIKTKQVEEKENLPPSDLLEKSSRSNAEINNENSEIPQEKSADLNQSTPNLGNVFKDLYPKKQSKSKNLHQSNETNEFEVEFWKDQNASCYMTFKPGLERQIVKRVKNNTISYSIEYSSE